MSQRRYAAKLLRDWARVLQGRKVLTSVDRKACGDALKNIAAQIDADQDALDQLMPPAFPDYSE